MLTVDGKTERVSRRSADEGKAIAAAPIVLFYTAVRTLETGGANPGKRVPRNGRNADAIDRFVATTGSGLISIRKSFDIVTVRERILHKLQARCHMACSVCWLASLQQKDTDPFGRHYYPCLHDLCIHVRFTNEAGTNLCH